MIFHEGGGVTPQFRQKMGIFGPKIYSPFLDHFKAKTYAKGGGTWHLAEKNPYSKEVCDGFPYGLWLLQEFLETMHQFANQGEEEKLSFLFKVNLICAPLSYLNIIPNNMDFWLGVRSKWRWPNWWRRIKRHNCLMRCRERNGIRWTAGIIKNIAKGTTDPGVHCFDQ